MMTETLGALASRVHYPVEALPPVESGTSDIERRSTSAVDGGGAASVLAKSDDYRSGFDSCPVASAVGAIADTGDTGGDGGDCSTFAAAAVAVVVVAVGMIDIVAVAVASAENGSLAKLDGDFACPETCLTDVDTAAAAPDILLRR